MERIPEPELMNDPAQVDAYACADFSESHDRLVALVGEKFPGVSFKGLVLNLGCGSGDDTFRFLRAFPDTTILAVDGAPEMIQRAEKDLIERHPDLKQRVEFSVAYIPSPEVPKRNYQAIFSNSLLHHIHAPGAFWTCIKDHSTIGTPIFIGDLRRPNSLTEVEALVAQYMSDAPQILQEDFRNSLKAAYTVEEVEKQLENAGIHCLRVIPVGDRHQVVFGTRE